MERFFKKIAAAMRNGDELAYVRRSMWHDLENRLSIFYRDTIKESGAARAVGDICMTRGWDFDPIKSARLLSSQRQNSIHFAAGHRLLGLTVFNKDGRAIASEWNAQLWYAEGPSGQVMVFVAPFKSNVGKIDEDEILIGKYVEACRVGERQIRRHFRVFFRYCASTSQHRANRISSYLYRRYVMLWDFRLRSGFRDKALKLFERVALISLGAAAVWATLYAGNKI